MDKELDDRVLVRFRKLPLPVRVVYARPRTFIAIARRHRRRSSCCPRSLRLVTRLVVGWDVFAALYLVLVFIMMLRSDVGHIRRNAVMQDDGRFLILLVTALGAFASIAAIVFELGASQRSAAGADPRDRDDRAVLGGGAYHLRAALRPRVSTAAASPAACSSRAATRTTTPTIGTSSTSRS